MRSPTGPTRSSTSSRPTTSSRVRHSTRPSSTSKTTATAVLRLSLADAIVNNKITSFTVDLSNTSTLGTMAATPATLVDYLGMLLMHSKMPANMRTTIINTITPLTSNAQRVRVAIYLVVTSSQYKVIH